jgi:hypothetical protein
VRNFLHVCVYGVAQNHVPCSLRRIIDHVPSNPDVGYFLFIFISFTNPVYHLIRMTYPFVLPSTHPSRLSSFPPGKCLGSRSVRPWDLLFQYFPGGHVSLSHGPLPYTAAHTYNTDAGLFLMRTGLRAEFLSLMFTPSFGRTASVVWWSQFLATERRCIVFPVRYELNLCMLCRR